MARVIWINGPFGGGKTTVAFELAGRLKTSIVFDPEDAGYYLRKCQPKALQTEDFQDDPLWREINLKVLADICRRHMGTVIVPMTIVNPDYYVQIIGGLRGRGFRVDHYTLVADASTIRRRLAIRAEGPRSWAANRVDGCLKAFKNPMFKTRIKTDNLPPHVIAGAIARMSGLEILPPDSCAIKRGIRSLTVSIRHIHALFG